MSDLQIEIVLPEGVGTTPHFYSLAGALRMLTEELSLHGAYPGGGCLGGEFGYGAVFENDVFTMHPYCWCDRMECPWCCWCDESRPDNCACDFCSNNIQGAKGGTHERPAPNFWHKESGLKVWWYKWIGRSMLTEGPEDRWQAAIRDALASLPTATEPNHDKLHTEKEGEG